MKMHHIIPAALRPSFIVAVLGAIVATFVVTGTLTAENLGDDYGTLATESFIPDADVDVLSKGVKLNTKTVSPVSDPPPPPPGVEATGGRPKINNQLISGNYVFKARVQEAAVDELGGR